MNTKPSLNETADPIDIHVGQRLRARRTLIGMSQEKLAECVGLTFQQIQKYERGINRMGASRLYQFAKVLSIPVAFFFEEYQPQPAPGFREPLAQELPDLPANDDPMRKRETLELIRAYYRIDDPKQRRKILDLVRSMGE